MSTITRPGTLFQRQALRAVPGFPTDTGQAFFVGFAEKGPTTPVKISTPAEFEDVFGGSSGVAAVLADSAETFFGERGATLHVCRVVGPTPVAASVTLQDSLAVATLTFTADSVGVWANGATGGLDVVVGAGTTAGKKVQITLDDVVVEEADNLETVAEILAAFGNSSYVIVTDEASGSADPLPANGTFPLAGGTDDNTNATDAEWQAALDAFDYILGPGQVAAPGRTSSTAHTQLLTHAADRNRTALLDGEFEATKLELVNAAAAVEDLVDAQRGGLWSTWLQIPQAVAGVNRYVPPSAALAGLIAATDARVNPGQQPIAEEGRFQYVTAAVSTFGDADRTDLYEAGVNVVLDDPLGLRNYGFRSVTTDDRWRDLSHNRIFMEVEAQSKAQDEFFVGDKINARTIGEFNSAKKSLCRPIFDRGDLFGDTSEEAFRVETGPTVNTPATIAARDLRAEVYLRVAESTELVRTVVTKVPVTTTV